MTPTHSGRLFIRRSRYAQTSSRIDNALIVLYNAVGRKQEAEALAVSYKEEAVDSVDDDEIALESSDLEDQVSEYEEEWCRSDMTPADIVQITRDNLRAVYGNDSGFISALVYRVSQYVRNNSLVVNTPGVRRALEIINYVSPANLDEEYVLKNLWQEAKGIQIHAKFCI